MYNYFTIIAFAFSAPKRSYCHRPLRDRSYQLINCLSFYRDRIQDNALPRRISWIYFIFQRTFGNKRVISGFFAVCTSEKPTTLPPVPWPSNLRLISSAMDKALISYLSTYQLLIYIYSD